MNCFFFLHLSKNQVPISHEVHFFLYFHPNYSWLIIFMASENNHSEGAKSFWIRAVMSSCSFSYLLTFLCIYILLFLLFTQACLRMFLDLDLIGSFHIEYEVLCRWLLSVKKNYCNVTCQNWRHAFNVVQMVFAIITVSCGLVLLQQLRSCDTEIWLYFGACPCFAVSLLVKWSD